MNRPARPVAAVVASPANPPAANPQLAPHRRTFLAGAAACSAVASGAVVGAVPRTPGLVVLHLTGGPSPFETWDPQPSAPAECRGPWSSIATALPGIRLSEHFPELAVRLDRLLLFRGLHHSQVPTHRRAWEVVLAALGPVAAAAPGARPQPGWDDLPAVRGAGPVRAANPVVPHRRTSLTEAASAAWRTASDSGGTVVVHWPPRLADDDVWDLHAAGAAGRNFRRAAAACRELDAAAARLVDAGRAEAAPTLIVVGDVGRAARLNRLGGRDHASSGLALLACGPRLPHGAVVGGTSASGEPTADALCLDVPGRLAAALGL